MWKRRSKTKQTSLKSNILNNHIQESYQALFRATDMTFFVTPYRKPDHIYKKTVAWRYYFLLFFNHPTEIVFKSVENRIKTQLQQITTSSLP